MKTAQQTEKKEYTFLILAKALFGAIIGSVPSMLLWIVLGKVGIVAAIAGFFMMAGELIACDHFTRKSRNMNIQTAVVICAAVMLVNVYFCERFIWSWELSDLFYAEGYYVSVFECFADFGSLTGETGIREDFTYSLVQSYLYALLGAVAGYKACKKFSEREPQ